MTPMPKSCPKYGTRIITNGIHPKTVQIFFVLLLLLLLLFFVIKPNLPENSSLNLNDSSDPSAVGATKGYPHMYCDETPCDMYIDRAKSHQVVCSVLFTTLANVVVIV